MHAHMGQQGALLNIAAGVTSVRDMGNNNVVLKDLKAKITSGVLAGNTYINIHSSGFPGGEIRGHFNVVPEPGSAMLFVTGSQ